MLSEEETNEIKQKIISQIESTFPIEQVANARQQIEGMNSEQLEKFLERNKMMVSDDEGMGSQEKEETDCVFCSIVSEKIKSVKIGENKKAIAVLEINPISIGHSLIIPKEHSEKPSKEVLILAEKISELLKKKLNPKKVEISKSRLFGHEVISLLPVYENEHFNSERKHATVQELETVKEDLEKKTEKVSKKPKIEKIKEIFYLPKRIP